MFHIDSASPTPIYRQITESFIRLIRSGKLATESHVPSIRVLAAAIGTNPNTVQKAFTVLAKKGYLYSVRGKGHFAGLPRKKQVQKEIKMLYAELDKTVHGLLLCGESLSDIISFLMKTP